MFVWFDLGFMTKGLFCIPTWGHTQNPPNRNMRFGSFVSLNLTARNFIIQLMLLFSIVLGSRPSPLDDVYGTKMLVRSGDFLC